MTTIERLGIRGIRSYDQDEETVVRFEKPLTIFCGSNGSGKSTVVEAVKMAITGDLPPVVDKGAAFINDPRIHSNTETRAKIRLKFTNINGDPYLVNRQFSLINKPNKRQEFKTTEQTLQKTEPDGKKSSTSYRLAHLNALLPEIMGVSKPVLDNVIFVHQEESLWPLGDPKKLKEKFDDIFAATRYTKALEVIRKYRKEQAAELKLVSKDLQFFEDKVKALDKLKMEHDKLNGTVHDLDNAVALLKMDIKELDQEINSVKLLKAEYSEVREKLNEWKSQEKSKSDLQKTVYDDLDEDLSHLEIADITIQREELKRKKENLLGASVSRDKKTAEACAEEKLCSAALRRKIEEKGRLDSEADSQEERLRRIRQLRAKCSNGFFSGSVVCPQTNASTDDWSKALRENVYNAEKDFRELQHTCRKNEDDASDALNEAQRSLEQMQAEAERLKNRSAELRKQAHSEHGEMLKLSKEVAGRDSKALRAKQAQLRAELDELQKTCHMEKLAGECAALRRQYEEITNKTDELSLKQTTLHQKELMQSRIRVVQEEIAARDKVRDVTIFTFAQELGSLSNSPLSSNLPPQTLRKEAESVLNSLTAASSLAVDAAKREVESSTRSFKEAEVDVACRRARLKEVEDSLTTIQMKMKARVDKLSSNTRSSILEGQRNAEIPRMVDVVEALEKIGMIIEKSSSMKACISTVRDIRGKEKEFVAKYNRCPTCSCEFKAKAKREKVLEFIDNRIKSELHEIKKANQSRSRGEHGADMELLRSLKEMIARHDDLSEGLSEAQSRLGEAEEVLRGQSLASERAERDADEATRKAEDTNHALELMRELKHLDSVIEELERKKGHEEALCGTTFQDSEGSISEVKTAIEVSREEREKIQKDLNLKESERKAAEERLNMLNTNMHNVSSMLEEGIKKDLRISELKNKASELQADAAKADKDFADIMQKEVPPRRRAVSELACEKEAVRVENQHQLEKNECALKSKQKLLEEWEELIQQVETYERSGKGGRRERLEREVAKAEEKIRSLQNDIDTWNKEARVDSEAAGAIERRIDNLSRNRTYIDLRQQLSSIRISIKDCEREMVRLTKRAGGKSIDDKLESLTLQKQDIIASKAATEGKRFTTERNRDEKRQELQEAEKEGSRERFDESRIKHQTMSLACADLDRYHRALDKALMAFHHLKMTSINKCIKELWQRTYSGNDIDSIAIVSDVGDENRSRATVRRSYNYRVEMRRGDAWLDMRGRCSAGQKVLACLVIRLALAESFCTNCGILALDEPTTNLDEANIESLAEALSNIIDTRKTQSTFQLILITHDFQFIERIGARSFCNEYYLVHKDPDGFSKIKAQSILGIE